VNELPALPARKQCMQFTGPNPLMERRSSQFKVPRFLNPQVRRISLYFRPIQGIVASSIRNRSRKCWRCFLSRPAGVRPTFSPFVGPRSETVLAVLVVFFRSEGSGVSALRFQRSLGFLIALRCVLVGIKKGLAGAAPFDPPIACERH